MYELCTKNGILLDVIVYSGDMTRELLYADEDLLTSESIPLTLMQPYLGKGYRLFVDNYYTSPRLAQFLLKNNVTLVDTVRASRHGFPADLAAAAVERGETKFALSNNGVAYCSQIQVTSRQGQQKNNIVYLLRLPCAYLVWPCLEVNPHDKAYGSAD